MDKKIVEQGQRRDPVPQEIKRAQEKRSFHIQVIDGKD
jgi:hypothetical protein